MDTHKIAYSQIQADSEGKNTYLAYIDFGSFSNGQKAIKAVWILANNISVARKCVKANYPNADYMLLKAVNHLIGFEHLNNL